MSMAQTALPEFFLTKRRTVKASPEILFKAWTDPDALMSWFCPGDTSIESAEVDLKVGGEYSLGLKPAGGELFYHRGVYQEIQENEKLVFTWLLEGQDCDGCSGEHAETVVTVEFNGRGDETEVVLTHVQLPSEVARDNHDMGWGACLDCLEEYISGISS